ncbi:MAG: hypothetical protein KF773_30330 [Deltaproteobacteria bacterium]|nr:hypothetical protein [Deltaproteobacteria bacterium]
MRLRPELIAATAVIAAGLGGATRTVAAPTGGVVTIEHRDPTTAPTRGPSGALVTIEVFFAPQINLGGRIAAYRSLERLMAKHPTRIRVVYRIMRRGGNGPLLAVAALEAHAQGKFYELMEKLHTVRTNLQRDQMIELGTQIGMDAQRLEAILPGKPGPVVKVGPYDHILDANEQRFDRLHGLQSTGVFFNSYLPKAGVSADADYEREYQAAFERALELLDRGVDPRALAQAFDDQVLRSVTPLVMSGGSSDDDSDPSDHKLVRPPLQLAGLPSFGRPGPSARLPIVALCRPNDAACNNTLRTLRQLQETYTDDVRIVWAPYFDVTRDDAAELAMLGDAVLCAETVGSSPDDLAASPGWRWITKQLEHASRAHGRRVAADKLIDTVSSEIDVDPQKLAACRARMAGTTLQLVERARRSGIAHAPALVLGGRIYESVNDKSVIQQLIEAEIAPGVLGEVAPAWRPLSKAK